MNTTTKEYEIEITETLTRRISICAQSHQEALEESEQAWKTGAIALDSSDLTGVDFDIIKEGNQPLSKLQRKIFLKHLEISKSNTTANS